MLRRLSLVLCCLGALRAVVPVPLRAADATAIRADEPALERLWDYFRPTLDANEKHFRGLTGMVHAFGAGSLYPQVWLRDSATLIPLTRYLYPETHMRSWIDEHFAHQQPNGALYDWIAAGPLEHFAAWAPRAVLVSTAGAAPLTADKNTVEADQESSAVLAALAVSRILHDPDAWDRDIGGRSLLMRCQDALHYLVRRRYDGATGLVTSGFSADWGDVSPIYADQRAIYLDADTPRVVGLYTNALFYAAVTGLRDAFAERGYPGRAAYWDHIAGRVKQGVDAELWQEKAGFYQMSRLLQPRHGRDWNKERFALGGHAVAARYGLVGPSRIGRVLAAASAAQKDSGASTIGGTLQPAFSEGFFKHPAMMRPYQYQNGGQWDWYAGRLILAAFEAGYSEWAYDAFVAIARKAVANEGLHEWHTLEGEGRGSATYSGSAGALGTAMLRGLYGVNLSARRLEIWVRLGEHAGGVQLREPATETAVDYDYAVQADTARLTFSSNHPEPGRVVVRLPPGRLAVTVRSAGVKAPFEARSFELLARGDDSYVSLDVAHWHETRLEIALEEHE